MPSDCVLLFNCKLSCHVFFSLIISHRVGINTYNVEQLCFNIEETTGLLIVTSNGIKICNK